MQATLSVAFQVHAPSKHCQTGCWALYAGLQSESLQQLFGPDDAAASARGYGIRRLIANMMLGVFPCLEDNADCVFPPLAAWQVHNWWLSKPFTTRASVRQFQVFRSLHMLHWHGVTPVLLCCRHAFAQGIGRKI